MKKKFVFATNNAHKLEEVTAILGDKIELLSMKDIHCSADIPETADTLEGNALLKASRPVPSAMAAVMAQIRSSFCAKSHNALPNISEKLVLEKTGSPVLISNFEIPWFLFGPRSAKSSPFPFTVLICKRTGRCSILAPSSAS